MTSSAITGFGIMSALTSGIVQSLEFDNNFDKKIFLSKINIINDVISRTFVFNFAYIFYV